MPQKKNAAARLKNTNNYHDISTYYNHHTFLHLNPFPFFPLTYPPLALYMKDHMTRGGAVR